MGKKKTHVPDMVPEINPIMVLYGAPPTTTLPTFPSLPSEPWAHPTWVPTEAPEVGTAGTGDVPDVGTWTAKTRDAARLREARQKVSEIDVENLRDLAMFAFVNGRDTDAVALRSIANALAELVEILEAP